MVFSSPQMPRCRAPTRGKNVRGLPDGWYIRRDTRKFGGRFRQQIRLFGFPGGGTGRMPVPPHSSKMDPLDGLFDANSHQAPRQQLGWLELLLQS